MAGTTPKARALGAELRTARDAAGFSVRTLATALDISHATLSRWETGDRSPKPEMVAAYLAKVDAPAELRSELVELARNPDGPHWLSVGMPEQQRQLGALVDMESTATAMTTVAPNLVPGLLQTADYARAIMVAGNVTGSEIATRVAVRVGRREAIVRKNPVQMQAFIGEPVLMQTIGGAEVMADQLAKLLDFGQLPNVTIRVMPTRCEWHPGLEGPFLLMDFADQGPVVHLENRVSALFLHEPNDMQQYRDAAEAIAEASMSEADSRELIAKLKEEKE
ncbi:MULTISPECIES: helix-turn-helix transcriptional regulator [unclassified Saccharopolyspora]|uniref:helix-turn-helix domain-containing protein n=2 Tax=Pseudonocardiaceae TaxID=2070 RepID=UPI0019096388|nr:helix-turn-helix transcriptional regulator [Saccharopolyspora sp. HNM0986]MBK0870056.1 helix-turn-helix domain-containing protein [Saccharopolyspora sp. HNM0986]